MGQEVNGSMGMMIDRHVIEMACAVYDKTPFDAFFYFSFVDDNNNLLYLDVKVFSVSFYWGHCQVLPQ